MLLAQMRQDRKMTSAPFCTRVGYEIHVLSFFIERSRDTVQLTKWPHKHTLWMAVLST